MGRGLYEQTASTRAVRPSVPQTFPWCRLSQVLYTHGTVCILYTHLGKVDDPHKPFNYQTCQGLRELARRRDAGDILVTTAARLLRYVSCRDSLQYSVTRMGERVIISLDAIADPVDGRRLPTADEIQGITFVIEGRHQVEVKLCHEGNVTCDTTHLGERTYTSIPWRSLLLPTLTF